MPKDFSQSPTWRLEKRLIKDLTPHSKNPRKLSKHDAGHLQKSLEKFGIIEHPCINTDNTIIGGHQRIEILKEMGIEEVEVWVPSFNLANVEVDELNIRLNRNLGEWDFEILANEWEVQDLIDWGLTDLDLDIDPVVKETPKKKKPKICPECGHEF